LAFFTDQNSPAAPPQIAARASPIGATAAVLKYAPRRLRPESGDDAAAQAQAQAAYWRERAFKAETRLRALETRLQSLARRTLEDTMANDTSISLPDLDDRIAIIRDNLRQLTEQAAAFSGAADEERSAERIAAQQEELDRLVAQRDALKK
jgi:uncharacterized small protein (DUF1192 family)